MTEELTHYQLRGLGSPLRQLVELEGPDKYLIQVSFIRIKSDNDVLVLNRSGSDVIVIWIW